MTNPYKILGVTPSSSDEEIKRAYRSLAKKYHPDNYTDSNDKEFYLERMKQINEAYDLIMNQRKYGKSAFKDNFNSNGENFSNVRALIMNGFLEEAETILNGIPSVQRDAQWYFLKATIFYKRGWLQEAYINFARACDMDPTNREYRAAYEQMQRQRTGNFGGYDPINGTGCGCSFCDVCTSLLCADCCCECMGGDFIRCC